MIWPLKFLINQMYNGMENELTLDHAFSACLSTKVYEKKTKQPMQSKAGEIILLL